MLEDREGYLAQYQPRKAEESVLTVDGKPTFIQHWLGVYPSFGEACKNAAVFIRDSLLGTDLRYDQELEVIELIEDAIRAGAVEDVIAFWNDAFPDNEVKIYKDTGNLL